MNISLKIFNSILFSELNPSLPDNSNDTYFKDILNNQLRKNKDNPAAFFSSLPEAIEEYFPHLAIPKYKDSTQVQQASIPVYFDFLKIKPFYNKPTEFYSYLIKNECSRIIAELSFLVNKVKDDIDKTFQVSRFQKQLEYFIHEIPKIVWSGKQPCFVLDALKISIYALYNEVLFRFASHVSDDVLSDTEILDKILPDYETQKLNSADIAFSINQFISGKNNVSTPAKISNIKESDIAEKKSEKPSFVPNKSDFRTGYKGKLSFDDIQNVELFSKLELNLYNYDFIDLNYNFTNKHNKKKELAAIFKILIQKKYFRQSNFKHSGKFRDADYRQYLDCRYNVDTSQQFRKCSTEIIESVSNTYHWIDTLPACR